MYAGTIVEQGRASDVIRAPLHPYTKGLLGSVPSANARGARLAQITGMTPSLLNLPPGCRFRARCPRAAEECGAEPAITSPDPGARGALLAAASRGAGAVTSAAPSRSSRRDGLEQALRQGAGPGRERLPRWLGAGDGAEVVHAVDNVSLSIAKGEVVGLVGESGCGKSTSGRMIAGLLTPSEGQHAVQGPRSRHAQPAPRPRRRGWPCR